MMQHKTELHHLYPIKVISILFGQSVDRSIGRLTDETKNKMVYLLLINNFKRFYGLKTKIYAKQKQGRQKA